jgi:hypothetical protein
MTSSSSPGPPGLRPFFAKLVIAVSAAVAVATSAPPRWNASESDELVVALEDANPRQLLVTLELGGALYADALGGGVVVTAVSDRAASDLTLSARRLTPVVEVREVEAPVDGLSFDEGAALDGGAPLDGGVPLLSASPSLESPDRASLWFPLGCPELASTERRETCVEVFQVTLLHASERSLNVTLHIAATLGGSRERRPSGTFTLAIEEVAP